MALFDLIPQPFLAGFVTSEAELRAFDYTTVADGDLLLVQLASGRTAFVQWSATSLLPDDPERGVVRPTAITAGDPGRWLWHDYAALAQPKGAPAGQLGNTWASPDVRGIRASDGTLLAFGAVTDGQVVGRVGTTLASQTTLRGRLLALSQASQTQAAAATIDWTSGHKQLLNMTGNVALTFTAPGAPTNLTLVLVQDATGGHSPTWPATARAVGGQLRVATAANAVTVVSMYFDGTNYWMDSAPGLTGPVSTQLV